jgi:hypothetical protein
MYATIINKFKSELDSAELLLRLVLYNGELYRLPRACKGVRVISGYAWITSSGQDITLTQGEHISFSSDNDFVLVSTLRQEPLVFEIWGDHDAYPDNLHMSPTRAYPQGFAVTT